MLKSLERYREARRRADTASRGVSPPMFFGLASFYGTLPEAGGSKAKRRHEKIKARLQSNKLL